MIKRLFIRDRKSGFRFLIDTGSDIFIIPVKSGVKFQASVVVLYAANNSRINTYGERELTLDLGLWRPITWNFCRASVPYLILGADLLAYYGLSVDLRRKKLVDSLSGMDVNTVVSSASFSGISVVDRSSPFTGILAEFSSLMGLAQSMNVVANGVFHHILTRSPSISERVRRLSIVAKDQFKKWMDAGVCFPSSVAWGAPLHLAPKKGGGWRLCGDYLGLNAVTISDAYSIPFVQDFSSMLYGKTIFSKLDLHAAYNQIPIAHC